MVSDDEVGIGVGVEYGGLGFVDEVVLVYLVGDEVGFDLSLGVVLFGLLHDLDQLAVAVIFVLFQFLADEKKGDVEDSTRTGKNQFLPIDPKFFFGFDLKAGPVAALELGVGFIDGLAVDDPVDSVDDPVDVEVAFVVFLELVVEVVFILVPSEGVDVGPHEHLYLLQLEPVRQVYALQVHLLLILLVLFLFGLF